MNSASVDYFRKRSNEEIVLELLRERAVEESRRRFVEGLRRLRGHDSPDDSLTATSS